MRNAFSGSSSFIKIEWGKEVLEEKGWKPIVTSGDLIREEGRQSNSPSEVAVIESSPSSKKGAIVKKVPEINIKPYLGDVKMVEKITPIYQQYEPVSVRPLASNKTRPSPIPF